LKRVRKRRRERRKTSVRHNNTKMNKRRLSLEMTNSMEQNTITKLTEGEVRQDKESEIRQD
jgi:hypothetical protein